MYMHMLAACWAYHCTDPSGAGPKWSQYCGPPLIVYTTIGDKESWRQWWFVWLKLHVRAYRSWVWAPCHGSFSPVATAPSIASILQFFSLHKILLLQSGVFYLMLALCNKTCSFKFIRWMILENWCVIIIVMILVHVSSYSFFFSKCLRYLSCFQYVLITCMKKKE